MKRLIRAAEKVDPDQTISFLRELIRIPSPTYGEEAISSFVSKSMLDAGFDSVEVDKYWNILGTVKGSTSGQTLLLLTHLDSGSPGEMEDPYSGDIRGGDLYGKNGPVVYGHGAVAPKGSIAAFMAGARAMMAWGRNNWRGTIKIACVTKDLMANHDGIRELREACNIRADYAIAGEPSDNKVVIGARGISCVKVILRGVETHRGAPNEGVNPLYGLADLLQRVESIKLPVHPFWGSATTSPFDVAVEVESPNTPSTVTLLVDRRVLPGETIENVLSDFRNTVEAVIKKRPGLKGEVQQLRGMYPFESDVGLPIMMSFVRASEAVIGREMDTTLIKFSSNLGFVVGELGIPGVAFGPGRIEDSGPQENIEVDKVVEAARIIAAACADTLN